MAPWLVDRLIRSGVMTEDRVTKNAKPRRCPTCRLFILVGLDETRWRVEVDLAPTTTAGEAFALLCGRGSYAIDGSELYERTARRLAGRRADDHATYVEHRCGSPQLPVNEKFLPAPPVDTNGPPPF